MNQLPYILIVDDDEEIRDLLARFLTTQSFAVETAVDRRGLLKALEQRQPDLIVLDVMLPDGSGVELCRELRARGSGVPIILLTALKEDVDRIIGLEVGADDYMGKPFNPRELAARIRAILRRPALITASTAAATTSYRFREFTLEPATRRVMSAGGSEIDLTAAEFELLLALVLHPGRVLSRDQLLDLTRGREADSFDRSIDVLMSRLRRKLSVEGDGLIKTIRNSGYLFASPVEVSEVRS